MLKYQHTTGALALAALFVQLQNKDSTSCVHCEKMTTLFSSGNVPCVNALIKAPGKRTAEGNGSL